MPATRTHAQIFILNVERWVAKSSKYNVGTPSMTEDGSKLVTMEPLTPGHPKATNILLTVMAQAVNICGINLVVTGVTDPTPYEAHGFVPFGSNSLVRRPTA